MIITKTGYYDKYSMYMLIEDTKTKEITLLTPNSHCKIKEHNQDYYYFINWIRRCPNYMLEIDKNGKIYRSNFN